MDTDDASDILLGGEGSDTLEGKAGDDIIDGDAWLNVRISVRDKNNPSVELFTVDSMTEIQSRIFSREIQSWPASDRPGDHHGRRRQRHRQGGVQR